MSVAKNKIRVCFVAHFSYGAMSGESAGHIGGVERQTSMMARWFAARGHDVSILVWSEGRSSSEEIIDGVRVIKMCRQDEGVPGLRFFYPRWSSLIRSMKKANADLYYQNCGEYVTGQVALWCRLNDKRFIYSVASDPDCDPKLPAMKTMRERFLYKFGIRNADRIIVQTKSQQEMMGKGFGLSSVTFPMPCQMPARLPLAYAQRESIFRVIWVGRIARVKRLELLLDVARQLPEVMFDVVGGSDDDESYVHRVLSAAKALDNVVVHGKQPGDKVVNLYDQAAVLCCTSLYEGFPNTFLEAWSRGLPIVSTVDPDRLLESQKLGIWAQDSQSIASAIALLEKNNDEWSEISQTAITYFDELHAADAVMPKFEEFFQGVIRCSHCR